LKIIFRFSYMDTIAIRSVDRWLSLLIDRYDNSNKLIIISSFKIF